MSKQAIKVKKQKKREQDNKRQKLAEEQRRRDGNGGGYTVSNIPSFISTPSMEILASSRP